MSLFDQRKAHGYAPGNYMSRCGRCGAMFEGDKRACTCEACADKAISANPVPEQAQQAGLLAELSAEVQRQSGAHAHLQDWDEVFSLIGRLAAIHPAQPAGVTEDAALAIDNVLCSVLPGVYYMDPPDGGSITPLEQVRRMAEDAARYRFMRQNIDYTEDPQDGSGYYWHNQRGEFEYFIKDGKRPTFEEVIDAARAQEGEKP